MNNRSTNRTGATARAFASAVLFCGVVGAWPAAAQGRDADFDDAGHRYESLRPYGVSSDERVRTRGSRFELDRVGREAFERGYRVGRSDERFRSERLSGDDRDSSMGLGWNDLSQSESRERLERAAARLREALVLMQCQPSGRRLDEALDQARQALIRVQNAMTWLPREDGGEDLRRYERRSGRSIGAERASGGWLS